RFLNLHPRNKHRQRRLLPVQRCCEHRLSGGAIALIVMDAAHGRIVGERGLEGVIFALAAAAVKAFEHLHQIGVGTAQFPAVTDLKGVEVRHRIARQCGHHELLLNRGGLDGRHFAVLRTLRRGKHRCRCHSPRERTGAHPERPSHSIARPRQMAAGMSEKVPGTVDLSNERIHWDLRETMSYADYLHLSELLACQRPLTDRHDEMLFITIHQSSELWMKLCLHEITGAVAAIRGDELGAAFKMLARVARIQVNLIQSWEILSTMTPFDYAGFRESLGKSSGFQSFQYRMLEYRLGNKTAEMARVFD